MQIGHQILYFIYSNKNPVKDFIDSLDKKQKSKVFGIFQLVEEYGIFSVPQHIKKIKGTPFWEIRILGKDNIRLIFILDKSSLIIFHGFIKKTQKTPQLELKLTFTRFTKWKTNLDK
ncbi:hypothetical protein A2954_02225 [Candidatus Roizmanbacteria bacterium RIFCSPLOWO2_01_FULL_37_12]|uniref:Addiction module toxin RelE n=1 Tax=Candidatus Roizmanbacteria bacterium RIFCSPLOWO2_01_FULL_37_12 TaxID=1802056 RepID=A0A1F7I891_9BACT|nr:MAG: hypothetical protein A3D76_04825 [Candidatus Roizmanbacteria bacterium RIFCSPHIGHO2_02_FULL_37_9b]OGK39585.1 MAG: hypothetical protein A2954_02225 [Candidatus Roizmanbacteria bacterium RIFCSPLOWO2_01_FULL_37_12]